MGYRNITVNVEETIIKDLKQMALDEECSQKKLINEMLREGIDKKKGQTKLYDD